MQLLSSGNVGADADEFQLYVEVVNRYAYGINPMPAGQPKEHKDGIYGTYYIASHETCISLIPMRLFSSQKSFFTWLARRDHDEGTWAQVVAWKVYLSTSMLIE